MTSSITVSGPTTTEAGFAAGTGLHLDPLLASSTQLPGTCSERPEVLLRALFLRARVHRQDTAPVEAADEAQQLAARQGDAAGCRGQIRAGDMEEDGAAVALNARLHVVVKHDDQVIEAIAPPKLLGAARIGMPDRAVVVAVADGIAPAIRQSTRPMPGPLGLCSTPAEWKM